MEIIGGVTDLEGISHISSRRVLAQELFGKTYDAYDLQLKIQQIIAYSQKALSWFACLFQLT